MDSLVVRASKACRYNRAICQESRADKHLTVQVHLLRELEAMLLMVRLHQQV
ncbi:hypothetical protein D3C71_2032580 [compost metagenome]